MSGRRRSNTKKVSKGHPFDAFHKGEIGLIPYTGKKYVNPMTEMKPKKGKNGDYILEQTYAIIDRGDVKLRYTDTAGVYGVGKENAVVQARVRRRAQRGRPPLDMLLDEVWKEVVDVHQKFLGLHMRGMIEKRRAFEEGLYKRFNRRFAQLLGPDWYQELSNGQKRTVDNLDKCIIEDLRSGTEHKTLYNLAQLGLVPRPNREKVKVALENCCASPVEFLLTLYEISNPQRKFYSLNDRLLLSAVTHLTMENTLKELHIRIPSPPRTKQMPVEALKQAKSKKAPISPYLDTHIRYRPGQLRGFPGGPQKVYPMIDYVSYWKDRDYKAAILMPQGHFVSPSRKNRNSMECIKANEWEMAQSVYNDLHAGHKLHALKQVTIYPTCVTRLNRLIKRGRAAKYKTTDFVDEDLKQIEMEMVEGRGISQAALYERIRMLEEMLDGCRVEEEVEEEEVTVTELVYDEESCTLYAHEGCDCETVEVTEECGGACNTSEQDLMCTCAKEMDEEEFEKRRILLEAHDELRENKFVITHTTVGPDGKPIYSVGGVFRETEYRVRRKQSRGVLEAAARPPNKCTCKERVLARAANQCPCERCEHDRVMGNMKATLIIEGTQTKSGKSTRVVSGVKSEKICTCLEKFDEKCRRHEKRQQLRQMQEDLRSLKANFIITGTSIGPDGTPVYSLGGVKADTHCSCYDKERLEEEERKAKELAAVPPDGCLKYAISGVQARPDGNVYIISGVTPNTDCKCMELFYRYLEPHAHCLKAFEVFLDKLAYEIDMYFEELNPFYEDFDPDEEEPWCECESVGEEELKEDPVVDSAIDSTANPDARVDVSPETTVEPEGDTQADVCSFSECVDEECVEEEVEEEAPAKAPRPKLIGNLVGRYFILEKLPRKQCLQVELLRAALKMLADDGFPLARLPDAHRLPHFKVWFQMRAGKVNTREVKEKLHMKSITLWNRIDSRREKIRQPNLAFLKENRDKHNWRYNSLIRHANAVFKELYQRQIKSTFVNYDRDLFPTMFPYQLPYKGFRDTFFAYMPSKVEDVHCIGVWKPFEVRRQSVLRKRGLGCR